MQIVVKIGSCVCEKHLNIAKSRHGLRSVFLRIIHRQCNLAQNLLFTCFVLYIRANHEPTGLPVISRYSISANVTALKK